MVEIGGARCPCGRRGCMEAYAGRGAMEARARKLADEGRKTVLFEIMEERGRPRLTSGIWKRALDRDDDLAHELVDRAVRALGAGVASAVNVLDVDAVVIGGGLGLKLGEPYAERLRVAMQPHLFASERPPAIRLAALGDLGGAIGAASARARSPDGLDQPVQRRPAAPRGASARSGAWWSSTACPRRDSARRRARAARSRARGGADDAVVALASASIRVPADQPRRISGSRAAPRQAAGVDGEDRGGAGALATRRGATRRPCPATTSEAVSRPGRASAIRSAASTLPSACRGGSTNESW